MGTVLFPTLTGARQDGPECPPSIDLRTTPCWTGRIPETARQRPEALRSVHPTHSVSAIGAAAVRYASGHELTETPCDRRSPYYRLIDEGGFILMLGATQSSNTTLHCLEELAEVPYHLQDEWTTGRVIDADGREHAVRNRLHLWRWPRDFEKIDQPLVEAGALTIGKVGLAETRLMPARALHDAILPLMRADPFYLLPEGVRP
jgi:aminoglycoside 3-N-acetyltransferase